MKKKNKIIAFSVIGLALFSFLLISSCSKELDNKTYPTSRISGRFLYNGQPIQVMATSSDAGGSNPLQLIQTGPGKYVYGVIKMFTKADGTYTIQTFDGNYSLVNSPGKGPWLQPDTIKLTLKGEAKDVNFNVTPYHWISDYKSTFVDSVFTATFKLEKVVQTSNLERVVIYLGTSHLVDITSKQGEKVFTGITPGNVTVSFNLKTLSTADKVTLRNTGVTFARVGIKTQGVGDLLYSPVMELK
ncbi:DUF3823 domain-containing protein [Mucilaginibacter auburnensis]|uniref:Uncharacterized protein DUF3823 n=1 Tax=Mucilaginibacter auburnensis TaxID=1457233 RepID=A0A2H9VNW4_9SPHI|nr:DUF3823 domain-containing protein [Mucilaginibacter auburnensis]PJJ80001.1 uncharacterized protein DUF3823 [Mucilaginibacter auburnensis]